MRIMTGKDMQSMLMMIQNIGPDDPLSVLLIAVRQRMQVEFDRFVDAGTVAMRGEKLMSKTRRFCPRNLINN